MTDDAAPMLEIDSVMHRYGDFMALDDVSLTARKGEFLTILGESGSGKTTLLRVISGLEKPTSVRRLLIDSEDVAGDRRPNAIVQRCFRAMPYSRTCRWARMSLTALSCAALLLMMPAGRC